jgi:hypothetical protein
MRGPLRQRFLQRGKAADPVLVLDDDLAVDRRLAGECLEGCSQIAVPVQPVVTVTGQQAHRAVLEARERAIAVELDLVQPFRTIGCGRAWRCQLWSQERRQRRRHDTRKLRGLGCWRAAWSWLLPLRRTGIQAFDQSSGENTCCGLLEDGVTLTGSGKDVPLLDQKPVVGSLVSPVQPHEHPPAAQLLSREPEFQAAVAVAFLGVAHRHPGAPVPHDHRAGTILPRRDRSLEAGVFQRMILHVHGETAIGRVEAGSSRDRPALQHLAELQPKIIVEPARRMLLHDEKPTWRGFATSRFGRAIEAPLVAISVEGVLRHRLARWNVHRLCRLRRRRGIEPSLEQTRHARHY